MLPTTPPTKVSQPWFTFSGEEWTDSTSKPPANDTKAGLPQSKIRLLTWNIDCFLPCSDHRMESALEHLGSMVLSPPMPFSTDDPAIVMLQEMRESDLEIIQETPWVREHFVITDLDPQYWPTSSYGTTTLVDRRLTVTDVFRVPWFSRMGRDGLFVDIRVAAPVPADVDDQSPRTLRFCNSHLESLPSDPPIRPKQVDAAAPYLHAEEIHAAVLAGDTNAIQPSDKYIAEDHNLADAYLALGGEEESDEGYTWGYQSGERARARFGCSRMDKVFYCGGLAARQLVRIGVGVMVENEDARQHLQNKKLEPFVTDHYGLMAELEILPEKTSNSRDETSQ